jgi:Hint domain
MADKETGIGSWTDASLWSKGVPGANSNVKIDGVVSLDSNATVKSVTVQQGGQLVLNDGTLSVANGLVDKGTIAGTGEIKTNDIEGKGVIEAVGGHLVIDGSVDAIGVQSTTLEIAKSSELQINGAVGSSATVDFLGKSGTLNLSGEGVGSNDFNGTVEGFAKGDKIIVASPGGGDKVNFDSATDVLTVTHGGATLETIQLSGDYTSDAFKLHHSDGVDTITLTAACYVRGARILSDRGNVAIEDLKIGDRVMTRSGETRPIIWIGQRKVDCASHPKPELVWPICVSRNAFGENLPERDLWLSPGHNVFSEGVIMPIEALINEKTVTQHRLQSVEYWHIELDAHDIVFAEGLPSESYLDIGNRNCFANAGEFVELHPDFAPKHEAETCVRLVKKGEEVTRTKAKLLARVKALGHVVSSEADLHILADGRRIDPMALGKMRFAFVIPSGSEHIQLVSRTFVPAHTVANSADCRELGICVKRLQIDEHDLPLDHDSLKGDGWSGLERREGHADQRWTTGAVQFKKNSRLVIVDVATHGFYWDDPKEDVVRLYA